jgi:hypothetical protein
MLNLFYEEPDDDRWIPFDRHPRRILRRLVRGAPKPGGVMRWFLNLKSGLDQLGISYRVNDYAYLRHSPGAWAHVVGKPHVVEKIPPGHPIVYGPGVGAHPYENDFWKRADIRLILLSCAWFKAIYDRDLPVTIPTAIWAAGIDTKRWQPLGRDVSRSGILVYDKIRWKREQYETTMLESILQVLRRTGEQIHYLRYGSYEEEDYRNLLPNIRAMVFLCEHETQGFAYLQALASGVPILAWDRGGPWQDPTYFPDKVVFEPVTSVPYWDERCGRRFLGTSDFEMEWQAFWDAVNANRYRSRDYILEHLTLKKCARDYLEIACALSNE